MVDPLDYLEILGKLVDKTKAGRVRWHPEGGDRFACQLDRGYVFSIWKTEGGFAAKMEFGAEILVDGIFTRVAPWSGEPGGKVEEIFSVAAEERIRYPDPADEHLFRTLSDLYELARRDALKVPERLAEVGELLDKI